DAFFEHRRRRIADPGVDVAESLQTEQRRCMIDALKYVRGGLIDRRGSGACRGIGLRAGMDRKRRKAWDGFGHRVVLCGPILMGRSAGGTRFIEPVCGRPLMPSYPRRINGLDVL